MKTFIFWLRGQRHEISAASWHAARAVMSQHVHS